MTQILVTIEDVSIAARVMQAIEKMKGVIQASLYQEVKIEEKEARTYSPRIRRTRGIAKGVQDEIGKDDRLAYLLNK